MEESPVERAINELKGELMHLHCLTVSIARALPPETLARALDEFDKETEAARVTMLNAPIPDRIGEAFEHSVRALNELRYRRPEGS